MPNVNVKYKLTLDATVHLNSLKFENKAIEKEEDKTGTNYEGKIKDIMVDDQLLINLKMTGAAGKWKLDAWIRKRDGDGNETGDWKPLNGNDKDVFEDKIQDQNTLYGRYSINW